MSARSAALREWIARGAILALLLLFIGCGGGDGAPKNPQTTLTVLWDEGGSNAYEYKVFPHVDNQTGLKLVEPGAKKPLYFIKQ